MKKKRRKLCAVQDVFRIRGLLSLRRSNYLRRNCYIGLLFQRWMWKRYVHPPRTVTAPVFRGAVFYSITMSFNNIRTLKFKAQPQNASLPSIKYSAAPPSFRLLPSTVSLTNYRALGSNQKLGVAAEHLISRSEKRICR